MKNKTITVMLATLMLTGAMALTAAERAPALTENGQKLQERYDGMLKALRAELASSLPVINEVKTAAYFEARKVGKDAEAALSKARQQLDKVGAAQGAIGHAKGKWIGGAEKSIAAAEAALKKATTDAEREAAQKDLANWQKNKTDGLKELKIREEALAAAKREEPKWLQAHDAAQKALAEAQANELNASRILLAEAKPFLSSDKLDSQLVRCAVLADATPRGLAEFAQQGVSHEELVGKLLADDVLMKQMLEAGGAKGARYGQAMKIYTDILQACVRARERGSVFQRLALGTSLELTVPFEQGFTSFLSGKAKPVDPVKRYLNYEKAFLAGELDSAFKGLTAWECRFVSNDASSDEEIVWMREMMRNYRPDHTTDSDYKWRYVRIVRTDVGYRRPKWDSSTPELPMQQVVRVGGICHIRAWAGRLALRAFGIPAWGTEQGGHTAVGHWTPEGWVINLGAGWEHCWWEGRHGLDFLLETQARKYPQDYPKVLRAEWIGTALGETNYNNQTYPTRDLRPEIDGLWNTMALIQKKMIVANSKSIELAAQGTELGEANESSETNAAAGVKAEVTDADKMVVVGPNGVICIPAAACGGVQPMNSFLGGLQAFCGGGLTCEVDVTTPGKYQLTARVVNVGDAGKVQVTANNAKDPVDLAIPDTCGKWKQTQPVQVALVQGKNTLVFSKPVRGFTLKEITLAPSK